MKKLTVSGVAAMLFAFMCSTFAFSQTEPQPAPAKVEPPKGVVVDLSKPLPKTLDLAIGQNIVFENGKASVDAKETDGNGKLFTPRPRDAFKQVAAYRTTRDGKGEITVTFPNQGMLTVIRTETIAITVAKPITPGIEGTAIKSPILANSAQNQGKKNFAEVAGAVVIVKDSKGNEVARATTGKDGKYSIDLKPGVYTISSDHPQKGAAGLPTSFSTTITVKTGQREKIDVRFDTGIR